MRRETIATNVRQPVPVGLRVFRVRLSTINRTALMLYSRRSIRSHRYHQKHSHDRNINEIYLARTVMRKVHAHKDGL